MPTAAFEAEAEASASVDEEAHLLELAEGKRAESARKMRAEPGKQAARHFQLGEDSCYRLMAVQGRQEGLEVQGVRKNHSDRGRQAAALWAVLADLVAGPEASCPAKRASPRCLRKAGTVLIAV